MKWRVLGFILLSSCSLWAQKNSVSGVVIDNETKQPVPFANVFFANTTIGVSSDQDGTFYLEGFASGKYDLIVTFVGYTHHQQSLEFNGSSLKVSISLIQTPLMLNEVVVREDTTFRARNMSIFKKYFLGETSNAKHCQILNPGVIHLFSDTKSKLLVAHAKEPIQIENKAMGYRINYYLYLFEFDYGSGRISSFGVPSFTSMQAKNKLQSHRWEKERKRAYYGSINHFIRSFRSNQLKIEGYDVRKLYQVPNPERPSQAVLDAKIKKFKLKPEADKGKVVREDSLRYYAKLNSMPVLVDSVAKSELQISEVLSPAHLVMYKGRLSITYKKEREEEGYLKLMGRTNPMSQQSVVHFLDSLALYPNGYYEDQKDVFIENYWAWAEKISNYLPLDYQPIENQKNK